MEYTLIYEPYAEDYSEQDIGRGLIQGNTIDGCGDDGIYIYMDIYNDPNAIVNLGSPIIDSNEISNCEYGIYLEGVGQAQLLVVGSKRKT